MAKIAIKKASTDVTLYVFIQASNVTTGAGLTGLTFETANLVASYVRTRGARAALSLATQTVEGAHSDGGFVEVDATNMPGVYRLDLSDAVCATGVPSVVVMLKGAANMAPLLLEIQLTDFDLNDASPNVTVADIANDAITAASIATGAIDADAIADNAIDAGAIATGAITNAKFAAGAIDAAAIATDAIDADSIKADAIGEIADGVWDETIAGHTTGTTFGGKNQKVVPSETINDYKADVSALALEATLTAIKGATWTNETLTKIVADIAAISAGSGASVADIMNALLASYTVSGSVGESLGRLDNIQAKTDLITTGTSLSIASAVVGSTITAHRGDTLSAALENIGALTNYSKVWFTVKRDFDDADSAAVVQIEKTDGLKYLNGAAVDVANKTNGSITIQDEATGDVTVALVAAETAKLSPGNYQYDIQILRSAGTPVSTLTYGEFVVAADVTKATA